MCGARCAIGRLCARWSSGEAEGKRRVGATILAGGGEEQWGVFIYVPDDPSDNTPNRRRPDGHRLVSAHESFHGSACVYWGVVETTQDV